MYIALAVFIAKFCKMYTNFSLAHTNSYREIFAWVITRFRQENNWVQQSLANAR